VYGYCCWGLCFANSAILFSISSSFCSVTDLSGRIFGLQSTYKPLKILEADHRRTKGHNELLEEWWLDAAAEACTSVSCPFSDTTRPDLGRTSCRRDRFDAGLASMTTDRGDKVNRAHTLEPERSSVTQLPIKRIWHILPGKMQLSD
jgi:hypothetical protein